MKTMALEECTQAELAAIGEWYRLDLQNAGRTITVDQALQELRDLEASGQIQIEAKPAVLMVWRRLPEPLRGEQLALRLERQGTR